MRSGLHCHWCLPKSVRSITLTPSPHIPCPRPSFYFTVPRPTTQTMPPAAAAAAALRRMAALCILLLPWPGRRSVSDIFLSVAVSRRSLRQDPTCAIMLGQEWLCSMHKGTLASPRGLPALGWIRTSLAQPFPIKSHPTIFLRAPSLPQHHQRASLAPISPACRFPPTPRSSTCERGREAFCRHSDPLLRQVLAEPLPHYQQQRLQRLSRRDHHASLGRVCKGEMNASFETPQIPQL